MGACKGLLLALGLVSGSAGCAQLSMTSQSSAAATEGTTVATVPEGAVIKKEAERPKRDPKASTCVAYADFRVAEANAPDQSAQTRDNMREQARKAYLQALEADPKNLKAYQGLAKLQSAAGDHEQAIASLNKALKHHPQEASLWYELGVAHSRKKDWQPTLEAFKKAVDLDPQNRNYVNMYGFALARAGRYDESLACFARLNGEAKAHYNLARMLHHMEQRDLCKQHLQLALQKDPTLEPARRLLNQLDAPTANETPLSQTVPGKRDAAPTAANGTPVGSATSAQSSKLTSTPTATSRQQAVVSPALPAEIQRTSAPAMPSLVQHATTKVQLAGIQQASFQRKSARPATTVVAQPVTDSASPLGDVRPFGGPAQQPDGGNGAESVGVMLPPPPMVFRRALPTLPARPATVTIEDGIEK